MVQSVELRIQSLLLEHGDTLKVADILLKDWDRGSLSWMEQNAVGHFLITCGYLRAFFDQVSENLNNGQKIPWSSFLEALSLSHTSLSKEDFDQIFIGASEEQSLKDLVKCTKFDNVEPRFQKIRSSVDQTVRRLESNPSMKVVSEAKTQTVQRQKEIDNPRTPPVHEAIDFNPEWTGSVIARIEAREDDAQTLKKEFKKIFLKALTAEPGHETEAAIALGMMGAWQEGLDILLTTEPTFQRQLLELDFLLQAKKNLEVLNLAENLFSQSPNLEQKSYIQLMQAQALINLKKPNEAYRILENLVSENSDHLMARTLMSQLKASQK